jgi:two-component system response regulator RegX3
MGAARPYVRSFNACGRAARRGSGSGVSRVLVACGDPATRHRLVREIGAEHPAPVAVDSGAAAFHELAQGYDIVLLDDRLGDIAAADFLRRVRPGGGGIIVVSDDGSEVSRVLLLELGADDYVTRPYSLPVLVARMNAVLRRRRPWLPEPEIELCAGPVRMQVQRRLVTVRGAEVHVPAQEFTVLSLLLRRVDTLVRRQELMEECWGPGYAGNPQNLDHVIKRLRRRIELEPARPRHLLTIRRAGYALRP